MLIRVVSTHNTDGNPQRGWVATTAMGQFLRFIDEGYAGETEPIKGYDDGVSLTINVTPKEYKRLKNLRGIDYKGNGKPAPSYEYEIQGNYGYGQGYERLTTEATRAEALIQLKCYRENESVPLRIKRVEVSL